MAYTFDSLIEEMKLRGYLPTGTGLTTAQILSLFTQEMGLYIPAFLKGIREEFLVVELELPVTSAVVPIPARAAGAALRTAEWRGSDDESGRMLNRIEPERRPDYEQSGSQPSGYMFRGNSLILVPEVSSGTLRLSYQQRPGQAVLEASCGLITDIDTNTSTVTLDETPDAFTTDLVYDFVPSTPNFAALAIDQAVTSVDDSPAELVFEDELPEGLAVGDFVCIAGQTCIPQMPYELHTVLAQRVAAVIALATGSSRAPQILAGLEQAKADATQLLSPRNDGSMRPIISRFGAGRRGWWF